MPLVQCLCSVNIYYLLQLKPLGFGYGETRNKDHKMLVVQFIIIVVPFTVVESLHLFEYLAIGFRMLPYALI